MRIAEPMDKGDVDDKLVIKMCMNMNSNAKKKIKTIIVSAAVLAGTITVASFRVGEVKICMGNGSCEFYTPQEYEILKRNLFEKREKGEPLSWDEYLRLVAVIDKEIQKRGGIEISARTGDALLEKVTDVIQEKGQ